MLSTELCFPTADTLIPYWHRDRAFKEVFEVTRAHKGKAIIHCNESPSNKMKRPQESMHTDKGFVRTEKQSGKQASGKTILLTP